MKKNAFALPHESHSILIQPIFAGELTTGQQHFTSKIAFSFIIHLFFIKIHKRMQFLKGIKEFY
jgi:hypothetical protein